MLLQHPVGPYTTALMTAGLCVEAWRQHMLRLAQAVLRLHQLDGANFERLVASLQVCAFTQYPQSLFACLGCNALDFWTTQPSQRQSRAQEDDSAEPQLQTHLDGRLRAEVAALAFADATRTAVTILLCNPASSSRCDLRQALVLGFLIAARYMPAASFVRLAAPCSCVSAPVIAQTAAPTLRTGPWT